MIPASNVRLRYWPNRIRDNPRTCSNTHNRAYQSHSHSSQTNSTKHTSAHRNADPHPNPKWTCQMGCAACARVLLLANACPYENTNLHQVATGTQAHNMRLAQPWWRQLSNNDGDNRQRRLTRVRKSCHQASDLFRSDIRMYVCVCRVQTAATIAGRTITFECSMKIHAHTYYCMCSSSADHHTKHTNTRLPLKYPKCYFRLHIQVYA